MAIHSNNKIYDNKNVYHFFEHSRDTNHNMFFERNNWFKKNIFTFDNPNNIAIWLSSKGEVCYRTDLLSKIHSIPINNASIVLSNLLGYEIQIISKSKKTKLKQKESPQKTPYALPSEGCHTYQQNMIIDIKDLLLVGEEIFAPLQQKEFFNPNIYDTAYYGRNTFLPSRYLNNLYTVIHPEFKLSIIAQYIYYLANYQKDRFNFIMNWLATFFKNLSNKSQLALVFLGNKKSGKEILFDEIIKPLFGNEYCLKITDTTLETTFAQKLLKNKLFYNIDNISVSTIKDKKIINNVLSKDIIEVIENREFIAEYPKYGQTIITIDETYLPYLDKDFESYTLFKISDDIEQIYIPQELRSKQIKNDQTSQNKLDTVNHTDTSQNEKISKLKLIEAIRADLENFALILKGYSVDIGSLHIPFKYDDKKILQMSLEDKVKEFHNAILNYKNNIKYFEENKKKLEENEKEENLYETLISDFQINRIKQPNLIKYFQAIYNEEKNLSKRSLMSKLRKVDEKFYDVSNIKSKSGGTKYFELS